MKRILVILIVLASLNVLHGESVELKLPPYKKVRLKNGLTLLLMEQHEVPIVSFDFVLKTGSAADPAGKEGVASLTADLLRKGTKSRTADQIR